MNSLSFFTDHTEVYAGFVLAPHDNPDCRAEMLEGREARGKSLVWPRQCHSDIVSCIQKKDILPGLIEIPKTDAVITNESGVLLTSSHADCLPIYMYDPFNHAIGLAHSGWRGCLSGIGINMLNAMEREYGSDPENVITYIGPGIGFCCFEVDEDVMEMFADRYPWAEDECIAVKKIKESDGLTKRKYHIDLKELVSEYLSMEGIRNIQLDTHCTCCGGDDFWSFRRNQTGKRHLAYMELL